MLSDSGCNTSNFWCVHCTTVVQSSARRAHSLWTAQCVGEVKKLWAFGLEWVARCMVFDLVLTAGASERLLCCTMCFPPSSSFGTQTTHDHCFNQPSELTKPWKIVHISPMGKSLRRNMVYILFSSFKKWWKPPKVLLMQNYSEQQVIKRCASRVALLRRLFKDFTQD